MSDGTGRRVAIACQGGGSHTAFTAGVLQELVGAPGTRIAALSGTSGGAVCALLAWYGLLHDDPGKARDLLDAFWARTATEDPWETAWNELGIAALRIAGEVVTPEVSPYTYHSGAEEAFTRVLDDLIPFGTLAPPLPDAAPRLLVSAADVQTGEFRVFRSHGGAGVAPDHITSRTLLASAAVPPIFRAVEVTATCTGTGSSRRTRRSASCPTSCADRPARRPRRSGSSGSTPTVTPASRPRWPTSATAATSWRAACRSIRRSSSSAT